jgi:tetratricopeptide (TPR) repeat protein
VINEVRCENDKSVESQLDQTHRDTSANKDRGVRDFWELHCRLHDLQQQEEVWQQEGQRQSKGKELALVKEQDPFNGVAIGEDGKPVEKQIVLSKCYDKKHPGLAGGGFTEEANPMGSICHGILGISALSAAGHPFTGLAVAVLRTMVQMISADKKNAVLKGMLDKLLNSPYGTASELLDNANSMDEGYQKQSTLNSAAIKFIDASHQVDDGFIQAKSHFYAGVCYDLLKQHGAAVNEYNQAHRIGGEQRTKLAKEIASWSNFFKGEDQKTKMVAQLLDVDQFMMHLDTIINPALSSRPDSSSSKLVVYPEASTSRWQPQPYRSNDLPQPLAGISVTINNPTVFIIQSPRVASAETSQCPRPQLLPAGYPGISGERPLADYDSIGQAMASLMQAFPSALNDSQIHQIREAFQRLSQRKG